MQKKEINAVFEKLNIDSEKKRTEVLNSLGYNFENKKSIKKEFKFTGDTKNDKLE